MKRLLIGLWLLLLGVAPLSAQTYCRDSSGNAIPITSSNCFALGTLSVGISAGSTTSGQTGALVFGATTTSAPTYSNATSNPLSLDTSGNLRVSSSGLTFTVVTGSASATGAYSNMPIDLQPYPGVGSVTFLFTAAGNASNRALPEFSDDSSFTNSFTPQFRFVGSTGTHGDGTSAVQPVVNEAWSIPVLGRYFRLRSTANVGSSTDAAQVFIVGSNVGPTNVQQSTNPWHSDGATGSGNSNTGNPLKIGGVFNTTPPTITNGQVVDVQTDNHGAAFVAPYVGTAIAIAATGSTGAVTATLAGVSSKTTYICGFDISVTGGVATIGPITVGPLVGTTTFTYQLFSTATGAQLQKVFTPCIPASAAATGIAITTTADASATAVDINTWGFQY